MLRRAALALAVACAGLALTQCGAKACDASSCPTGCCDSAGTCRGGSDHWYCGGGGAACVTCAAGDTCNASQVCETVVVSRPDGGSNGGKDGGADAGVDAGCRAVAVWPNQFTYSGYSIGSYELNFSSLFTADPNNPPATGFDDLYLELYYSDGGIQVPYATTFSTSDTYANCATCLTLSTHCTGVGFCETALFAQEGSVSVTAATRNQTAGVLKASLANLKLVEWDFGNDAPVANGACVTIGSATWDVAWDAGVDGGP